ncbi:hypothetical protein GCE9029_00178 [Grimontia celer]|uniref:Uncharacterized protein n=1 Tax=Grimontia celer TaxID=1796497 RepID=A0A128ETG1_9GAMM|nr:hypothetical protein [Grimontia celer]CZF77395.1 hypothetical protein GCE9029_00178 [Grimontia celer]
MKKTLTLNTFEAEVTNGQPHHNAEVVAIRNTCMQQDVKEIEITCTNNQGGVIESFLLVVASINHAIAHNKSVRIVFTGHAFSCASLLYVFSVLRAEIDVQHHNVRLGFHTAQIGVQFQTTPKMYTEQTFLDEFNKGLAQAKYDESTVKSLYESFLNQILYVSPEEQKDLLDKYDDNANMMYDVSQGAQGELAYAAS